MSGNDLTGSIPTELGGLTNLRALSLSLNQLTGSIPTELGNLSNLEELRLCCNDLSDPIPTVLGGLTHLTHLVLNDNQLTGSIPTQLGNLSGLRVLYLNGNGLSGAIPASLGNLTNLWNLELDGNQLTGSIPTELGNLSQLVTLLLSRNQLSGPIPASLGNLTNLWYIYLSSNKLTGPIPDELQNLTAMYGNQSDFRWNAFYTTNTALKDFIDSKQFDGDWESFQTIAPANLATGTVDATSVALSWIATPTMGDRYEIYYTTTPGDYGSYILFEATTDETVVNTMVTGLSPDTTYYFALRTVTDSHGDNQNIVYSDYTPEVSVPTLSDDTEKPTVSSVTLNPPSPVKAGPVIFTITFSEDMDITVPPEVSFSSSGQPAKTVIGSFTDSTTWQGTYTIETGYDGEQTFGVFYAKDLAGNEMDPDTSTFIVDTTAPGAPSVSGTTPTSDTTPTWNWTSGGQGNGNYRYQWWTARPGTWIETTATAFTPATPLAEGSHTLYVQERDEAGNWSVSGSFEIVVDTGAPAAPTLIPVTSPTSVTPQTISGNKEANTSVWLNGSEIVAINASTSWSYAMSLSEGSNPISLTCKDGVGNESPATTSAIVLDTGAPAAPSLSPVTSPTSVTPQTISGNKEANTSVWLGTSQIVPLNASTTWSYDMPLVEGNNAISLTSKDGAGNESPATTSAIVLDTGAPAAPTLIPVTSPTSVTPQTISGNKEANTSVWLNGSEIVAINASTSWSYAMSLSEGSNPISLTCKDGVGNESPATTSAIVLDTGAPAAPSLSPVTSPTSVTPQTISGNKEANTSVWLGTSQIVPLNASTTWSYDMPLVEGNNAISLTSKDGAGNESPATTSAIVLDTGAPAAPTLIPVTSPTSVTPQTISGNKEANTSVWLNGSEIVAINASTSWSYAMSLSEGSNPISLTCKDGVGNESPATTSAIVLTTTPSDTTPPVISLLGTNPQIIEFGDIFDDPGATATDDVDGDLTSYITVGGDTVNILVLGSYTVTYDVMDSSGNPALQVTRTVNVVDTTPPSDPSITSSDQPINTPINNNTVVLTWIEGDDSGSGVAGYSWIVDNISDSVPSHGAPVDLPSSITLDSGDGDHFIHVCTSDNAGNWTNTYHYGPWVLDTTPPGTPIVSGIPATNVVTPTWEWEPNPDDGGNGNYRYQLNSEAGAWTETANTTYTPESPLVEGSHTLYVQEQDEAGNWSDSGSFITVVDITAPVAPAEGHNPVDGKINVLIGANISVNMIDTGSGLDLNTLVMKVEGSIVYDGSISSNPGTTVTGNQFNFTLTYDPPVDFEYEQEVNITVDASDLGGNPMIQENYSFITEPTTGNPWDPEGDEDKDDIPNEAEQLFGTNPDVKTLFVRPKKETGGYWEGFRQLFPDVRPGFADVPSFTHAGIEISVIGDPGNPYTPMRNFNYDPAQDSNHPPCDILEVVYRDGVNPVTGLPSYCAAGNNNYGHTYFSSIGRTWYWDTKGYVPNDTGSLHYKQHRYFTPDIYPFAVDNYIAEGPYPSILSGQGPMGTTCPFKQCYDTSLSSTMNLNADDPVSGHPDGTVEFNVIAFDYLKKITFVGDIGKEYSRDMLLRRIIAHEMGHAILAAAVNDHCSDTKCIMSGSSVDWEMHDFGPGDCAHSPGGTKDIRARGVIHNSIHY